MIVGFDDNSGEHDSFLSMDSVYIDKFDGTKRYDYGAKYNSVANISVSMIKNNRENFTKDEVRNVLKWLTGSKMVSWLDLYNSEDNIDYSFLGRFVDAKIYQNGSIAYGITAFFESISPFAYSGIKKVETNVSDPTNIQIVCDSDDLDTYIYPKVIFQNSNFGGAPLTIHNSRIDSNEDVKLLNLAANEVITMNDNQIIYSDNSFKIFGDDFNYKWLKLISGTNNITINGNGNISIQYRDIIKIGDAISNIEDIKSLC